jgi:hypothetical protein
LDYLDFTKQKLLCALAEVDRLRAGEFPQEHSHDCLLQIEQLFKAELDRLDSIETAASVPVKQATCLNANMVLSRFHALLGFVLRSTNVRNSFEIFDPILRMCQLLLGGDAKLVLSSEWMFSPFTLTQVFPELSGFVFIGIPASESGNALIVPSTGHEL